MAKKVAPKTEELRLEEDVEVQKPKAVITSATESGTIATVVKTTRELYMEPEK